MFVICIMCIVFHDDQNVMQLNSYVEEKHVILIFIYNDTIDHQLLLF